MFNGRTGKDLADPHAEARYLALRASGALADARRFDAQIRAARWSSASIAWRTPARGATTAGRQLHQFDRELRRATAIVRASSFRQLPGPLSLRDGRLEIREAQAGSLDLVLDALGIVSLVLLSNPVQLVLTTRALLGDALRVRGWLAGVGRATAGDPQLSIDLPDGGRVSAKHRLEVRGYRPDGSIDVIIAE